MISPRRLVLPARHAWVCCAGANSSYNIRVGRRQVHWPVSRQHGLDMMQGRRKAFPRIRGRAVGAGHFGRLDLGDGVQKFSCHYEADLDRGGISVLDIRPLLWRDGWPVAGENVKGGHLRYRVRADRHGARTSASRACRSAGARRRGGRGAPGTGGPPGRGGAPDAPPPTPIPPQEASQVSANWPPGPGDARMSPYMIQAQQQWAIAPVANAGGYPGSPFFKITIAGTDRALAATADRELAVLPAFTGARSNCGALTSSPMALIA